MMHIANTLARKALNKEAGDYQSSYQKYMKKVKEAQKIGYLPESIIEAIKAERERIINDVKEGDLLFQDGIKRVKTACLQAIAVIIQELEGETNVLFGKES